MVLTLDTWKFFNLTGANIMDLENFPNFSHAISLFKMVLTLWTWCEKKEYTPLSGSNQAVLTFKHVNFFEYEVVAATTTSHSPLASKYGIIPWRMHRVGYQITHHSG